MSQQHQLAIAQLAIYLVLAFPVLYTFFRHGVQGYVGWFYLFAFCSLRIIGSALKIHYDAEGLYSSAATIISAIGISPLLLGVIGVLHEARYHLNPSLQQKMEWVISLVLHMFCVTGIALVAAGGSALSGQASKPNDLSLIQAGFGILVAVWVVITCLSVFSLFQRRRNAPGHRFGFILLIGILLALPLIGIRVSYGLASMISHSANLNPITGLFGYQVGLSFVPELVAAIILILAGLATVDVSYLKRHYDVESGRRARDGSRARSGRRARKGLEEDRRIEL